MDIEKIKQNLLKEKSRLIADDMRSLCDSAANRTPEDVKAEAQVISRASEYAESMILAIIEKLKGIN